jgi:PAS domain-containing protein
MNWVDRLSERIAKIVVTKNGNLVQENDNKIEGIKQEIDILRELKKELVEKDKEIQRQRMEWDRTFDSIIDNICIIDSDMIINKVNNSFVSCVKRQRGPYDSLIGMPWLEFKEDVGLPSEICVVSECFETGKPTENMIDMKDGIYHVIANPITDPDTLETVGVVRISRDVTKYQKQKEKLERRSRIYHALSEMSKTLVNHEDWNEAVKMILDELGTAIGASRVYVFKNLERENRICSLLQHCFHNEKYRDCSSEMMTECVNYDMLPDWEDNMRQGNSVSGDLSDCQICPLKERCTCAAGVSVSAVPIFVDREWWGFIGFDYMNGTRKWKDEDETLLRIAADILGGVIYHRCRYWDAVNELEGCEDKLNGDCK